MVGIDPSALAFDELLAKEWLATNELGASASSTLPCLNTRKSHGLLVAALAPPERRTVLLSRVEESILIDGQSYPLASCEYPGTIHPQGHQYLRAFSPDPFPRWAYQGDGWTIEKQLRLLPRENTVCLSYTLLAGTKTVELELRPLFALRGVQELMYQWNGRLVVETGPKSTSNIHHRIQATNRTPEVFFAHDGRWTHSVYWYLNTIYREEQAHGTPGLEDVWSPGIVRWSLIPGRRVNFICSTDPIDFLRATTPLDREEMPASDRIDREADVKVRTRTPPPKTIKQPKWAGA